MSRRWSAGGGTFDRLAPARYRYLLWRDVATLSGEGTLLFVMLNPSTADDRKDDPTIRRCVGFTESMGYARLEVVNLFALRATDPDALRREADPVGPENDRHIDEAVARARHVVAAWGASVPFLGTRPTRDEEVISRVIKERRVPLYSLGRTGDGHPRHPLYVPASACLSLYRPAL